MISRITVLGENKLIKKGKTMRTVVFILLVAFMLSGCASIRAHPSFRTKRFNKIADRNPRWAEARTLNDKYNLDNMSTHYDNQPEPVKKEFRNNFINARILAIDLFFEDFQHVIAREGVLFTIGTDLSQLALTGASSVVPLKETKTVLSAIATGIGGAKGSVDKNLFFKQTMDVLLVKMKANRAEVLTSIQKKMKELGTDVYPLTAAMLDLEAYYRAGTLPQALIAIMEKSAETITESKEKTKKILGVSNEKDSGKGTTEDQKPKVAEPGAGEQSAPAPAPAPTPAPAPKPKHNPAPKG
jgi:hypothetical protein